MTDTSITSVVKIAALGGVVEMRIDESREIIQQARLNYLHFTMALALFGVVLISGTLFLVDRMMLARVTHLSSAVKTIGKSPGGRISVDGRDEISTLTEAINAMLVDVAESHQALESLNLQLEARVKERTAALEAQDARLRAIADTMGEGLAYTVDGSIEVANPTLAQMIGFAREELIGRPFNQLTPKMNMTVTQMMLSSPNRYETKLLRKDDSMIDVAINATPVNMGDARKRRVVIVRDITEEKALKQQRDYFFARASHELRTPLSNIMTRLYLLERDPEQSARHLDVLNKVSHHMLNLLNDLLLVSRLEAGMGLQKRPLDLRQLLYDVVEMQRSEAIVKKIGLEIAIPPERLQILADSTRLTQALTNILRNAILYTEEGGQVHVTAEPDPAGSEVALIRVRDTGIGIDAEHLPHLFDPFFRVKEGGMGAGLGLYITHEIIQLHGGAIMVESTLGVGTTFTVRLEIFPQPSAEPVV
ncbi:MAG: PAS domain S-box protein [Chloroflexi bacterium]|nr:PAS domain S-box protein [Chloroflexota bacterium]